MVNLAETRALLRGAAIAVMLGGLAGCTGNADAGPSPTTTVTAEPTGSASPETLPEKPQRPAAMDRDDAKGAAAAAEYFIELYPYVMATGDTSVWQQMAHESCNFCAELRDQALEIHENGEVFTGGETTVVVTQTYERDAITGIFPLDVAATQEPQVIVAADGSTILNAPKEVLDRRVEVGIEDGHWVMLNVAPIPAE